MKLLFTCGGTGGHIYPAVAVYQACVRHDTANRNSYLFVGSDYGLEKHIFAREGVGPAVFLPSRGFQRSLSPKTLTALFHNARALPRAKRIFTEFKPDLVVGTGAYPAFHMTYWARKTGTPYVLIEGNALPGLVTRLFYRQAKTVFIASEAIRAHLTGADNLVNTGLPLRQPETRRAKEDILRALGLSARRKVVTLVGGSCGSEPLNAAVADMVLRHRPDAQFIWATGQKEYAAVRRRLDVTPPGVAVLDYLDNIPEILSVTDLIVARAGAMTVQEIKAHRLPAVFVPFERAAGGHQLANALAMQALGVADIVREHELGGGRLRDAVESMLGDEARRADIAQRYEETTWTNPDEAIYNTIMGCEVTVC